MRKITKSEIANEPGYIRKVFYSAEDKCWVAIAPEIPGCSALGDTDNQALKELDLAIKLHLRIRKENKLPIPQALAGQILGGRFLLRIPKVLQRNLKEEAMEEGVSVNQYALFLISTARAQLHPFGRGV
ncbi:MAG: toxin-antitoxin system HicB family antitoxin [Elusimicrobiota bacterium]|nr:toxin-antitoxin system HicB family antitoxin [Elusimicrobiota bacterium]